jgi:hypothetical protein
VFYYASGGPDGQPSCTAAPAAATSADAKFVQDSLHYVHAVECPVKCICGRLYVRISGEGRRFRWDAAAKTVVLSVFRSVMSADAV